MLNDKTNKNQNLQIHVTDGTGEGKTNISAFDAALMNAGIANYNLIYLSSVIPKGSMIKIRKPKSNQKEYGNRLYVVMARSDQCTIGKEAWAGLGWIQDSMGRGLFAEHWAESKEAVIKLIHNSLDDMKALRSYNYGKIHHLVMGAKCKDRPVCALVMAVYKSENWEN
ncbi:pyruvoyl-dependent arginine decarboxylase [Patescibacteria group bacterium]|nr:pyruvoyl-dependent arginine decarboxylase [Patescibacteria group bacterium]MBU4162242.1 pyruvoyl-dependent arginine decarboxylase [Patescibacteria group bacterium]